MKTFNLEEHNSQQKYHVRTAPTNVSYAICKAIKSRLEVAPKLPGTYWKIVPNEK